MDSTATDTATQRHEDMAAWTPVLACPECGDRLEPASTPGLRCAACALDFPVQDGILSLMTPEWRTWADGFAVEYRQARLKEGWTPITASHALALPDRSPPGHPRLYWEVRLQSYARLVEALPQMQPGLEHNGQMFAADLGAGTGWLSYRLALGGYRVVALDASRDANFGIGAVAVYRENCPEGILAVQGNLEMPPLASGSYDLVIFNASLHYAVDLQAAVSRAARAVRTGGFLAVLDSPIEPRPRPGSGHGDRHLGHGELDEAIRVASLDPRWIKVPRGARWWFHQARAWARGHERFAFPLLLAEKIAAYG